jgi:hypothetical protein
VSNDCGAGGSIAAIAGRQTRARAAPAPATRIPAMTLATIRGDFFIRLGPSWLFFLAELCLTHIPVIALRGNAYRCLLNFHVDWTENLGERRESEFKRRTFSRRTIRQAFWGPSVAA